MIITDLMMPEMDGITFCSTLKANDKTSHIPVIMLTAKASHEEKVSGLHVGADDYLTKPFDKEELIIKIRNILSRIDQLHALFEKEGALSFESKTRYASVDQLFLRKINQVINLHYKDENFNVEFLAEQVSLSRSQLHRKLKALIGISANELIRNIRLEKAMVLLRQNFGNISEIAYQTGFSSPSYFSKCFADKYGYPPAKTLETAV